MEISASIHCARVTLLLTNHHAMIGFNVRRYPDNQVLWHVYQKPEVNMRQDLSDILIDTWRDRWYRAETFARILLTIQESGIDETRAAFDRNAYVIYQYCQEVN